MSLNPKALEAIKREFKISYIEHSLHRPDMHFLHDRGLEFGLDAAITAYLSALPPPAEARELVAKLRARAYLINGADQIGSRLYSDAADLIESLSARLETVTRALTQIAAFDDALASDRLGSNGSYGCFDEPGSVQIAREALAALKDSPNV